MYQVNRKEIFKYTFMPQVVPRFKELFMSGFQYVPYFIALVYQIVRLLPNTHPYLNPQNIGKYGVRHVIAEASNNLVISHDNIDQVLLYAMVLIGLTMAFIQVILLFFGFIVQPAYAQFGSDFPIGGGGSTVTNYFTTDPPDQDIAFMMLDMVFGVPGIFNSCVSDSNIQCLDINGATITSTDGTWALGSLDFPFPAHYGLHRLFEFYSLGLLLIAVLITIYFITTVIAETAQSGTPFGKRFNKVWAPIRLIVAIGLLIPISTGLNSSQYIVLYAAKAGSSFATNGWKTFTGYLTAAASDTEKTPSFAGSQTLIGSPNLPELEGFLQFLYLARICTEIYMLNESKDIEVYLVRENFRLGSPNHLKLTNLSDANDKIRDEDSITGFSASDGNTYEELIKFAEGKHNVTVRFGNRHEDNIPDERGNVDPLCGELSFNLIDPRDPEEVDTDDGFNKNRPQRGTEMVQRLYWFLLQYTFFDVFYRDPETKQPYALNAVYNSFYNTESDDKIGDRIPWLLRFYQRAFEALLVDLKMHEENGISFSEVPGIEDLSATAEQEKYLIQSFDKNLRDKGWGGAAIWYNKIAELNGSLTAAVISAPTVVKYPKLMERVVREKKGPSQSIDPSERFKPVIPDGSDVTTFSFAGEEKKMKEAKLYYEAHKAWQTNSPNTGKSGNAIEEMLTALLGTQGLYNMRGNTCSPEQKPEECSIQQSNTHPLAQITGLGRSLIQAAVLNLFMGAASPVVAAVISKDVAGMMTSVLFTIGTITLTLGFVLFYVVPFLPFIYFFFALGGWVKGIFEAMVGAPLWALAHLRIDGEGLPGQAAVNGYFLIFEIFLRPILIVFGLIASISIFSALVNVLNDVWDLVVSNAGGSSRGATAGSTLDEAAQELADKLNINTGEQSVSDFIRSPIDQFFFTVMYAVVVYMMAMSSFKLIDLIPNNILRWMGQSVQTFNDSREDAAQKLMGTSYIGGQQAIGGVVGGAQKATDAANQAAGGGGGKPT